MFRAISFSARQREMEYADYAKSVATIPAWQIVAHQTGWQTVTKKEKTARGGRFKSG